MAEKLKPTVRYAGFAIPHPWYEGHAYLQYVFDHPHIPPMDVTTSPVESWDKETGTIETRNTIYLRDDSAKVPDGFKSEYIPPEQLPSGGL